MPGRPKLTALKKRIAEEGLEDKIFEAVAEGLSMQKVCEKFDISSRKMLYDWKKNDPDKEAKFKAARTISADAHAEMAGNALDDLDEKSFITGPEVSLATAKAKYRQWLAGVRDKEQYGTDKGAAVVLNFGDMHLDALKSPGARPRLAAPTPEPELLIPVEEHVEAEFEIIEEEAGNDGGTDAQSGDKSGSNAPPASFASEQLAELL